MEKNSNIFNSIIEIPKGSRMKYEMNEKGELILDRVLPKGLSFPCNYAYIPNTLAGDGDPLDVLVMTEYSLQCKSHIPCRAVGVLIMSDEKGLDEKIIAVPTVDPTYDSVRDLCDIPEQTKKEIELFFKTYKELEKNKWVKIDSFDSAICANQLIEKYSI